MTDNRSLTQNEPSATGGDLARNSRADRSRQAVWGLPPEWRIYFLIIFTIKMSVWTALVVRHELADDNHAAGMDAAIAAMGNSALAMPLFGFTTILMLEMGAGLMITYNYLYNKIVQPVIDGHIAEGREQGIAIGEERGEVRGNAEGQAQMRAQFVDWLARKEEAERRGVRFDEPMPGADASPNGHSPQG